MTALAKSGNPLGYSRRAIRPALNASTNSNAVNNLNDEQRQELKECFSLFDSDRDGSLDYHELKAATRALGFDLKKAEVLKLIRDCARDGQGLMSFADFERIMGERILARDPIEEIKRAFALFDDNGSGKITLASLRRVAKELDEDLLDDELTAMIDEFDLDQDGGISISEFTKIMLDDY